MGGWTGTAKFVTRHLRRRPHRKIGGGLPHVKWDYIRSILDKLIKCGKIKSTLARCKEFQEYAEELIYLAKKDDLISQRQVESIIRTPRARQILYEELLPRYADRHYHFTRVVNLWYLRAVDHAHMGILELVDRPNEIRPARPVGYEKRLFLYDVMKNGTSRDKRKYWNQAVLEGVLKKNGKIVESKRELEGPNSEYTWQLDLHEQDKEIATPSVAFDNADKLITSPDHGVSQNEDEFGNSLMLLENAMQKLEDPNISNLQKIDKSNTPTFSRAILLHTGKRMIVRSRQAFEQFRTPIDQSSRQHRRIYRK